MLGSEIKALRSEHEFAMPPAGFTTTRARIGGQDYIRVTYRCPVEGCWYLATCASEEIAKKFEAAHIASRTEGQNLLGDVCPALPRRESLPSSLSTVQRLWNEIDDAMLALKSSSEYRKMSGDKLRGYLAGLAMAVVTQEVSTTFPDIKSVAIHAEKRRRMHADELPWQATPSSHAENTLVSAAQPWYPAAQAKTTSPAASTSSVSPANPARRRAANPRPTVDNTATIKAALASGLLSAAQIAAMYNMTEDEVNALA